MLKSEIVVTFLLMANGVPFSPLFSSGPNTTLDDEVIGNDECTKATKNTVDTVYHEARDEIIMQLDRESIKNDKGDLGFLDEEGDRYEVVQSFHEEIIDVEQERYDMDGFAIDRDVECDKNTAFACEKTDIMNTKENHFFTL
jgi:hypothetical protein